MNLESDLAHELDRAIPHLPAAPAAAYLASGRRARRRRAYAGVAGVAALALTGGAALSVLDDPGSDTETTGPATSVPSFDPEIPSWAQEYGNHGPVSIYPNGELWVAPDARLIRSVEILADSFRRDDVISAYVAEVEMEGEVWWSFVVRTSHSPSDGTGGQMEPARDWTTDFDVWVDYITAELQGRARFSERLVRFADDASEQLVARAGAQIVDQTDDVAASPAFENHPRRSVAEVTYGGKTWFVLAEGPQSGAPFYTPYQAEAVSVTDLGGFLDYLGNRVSEGK